MAKSNRFVLPWMLKTAGAIFGVVLAFFLAALLMWDPSGDESFMAGFVEGMTSALGPVIAAVVPMTMYPTLFGVALSMGDTRHDFFIAMQSCKLPGIVGLPLVGWLLSMLGGLPMVRLLPTALVALALGCFGELLGVLVLRAGAKGGMLFTVLCAAVGATMGISISMGGVAGGAGAVNAMVDMTFAAGAWSVPLLAGACLLMTGASWLMLRRAEM